MDETVTSLLEKLDALGVAMKEEKGEVFMKPAPPPEFLPLLREHKAVIANVLCARAGRARQQTAMARLSADRTAWIEEYKRLGKYRGP